MIAHLILYVRDQEKSTNFYTEALDQKPILYVSGMTEFQLNEGCILGLMPERGIKRLLGETLPDPEKASGIPRAEVYLRVNNPYECHRRALAAGAKELSPLTMREWGDMAAYSMDPDGHIIVFACEPSQT